MQFESGEDGGKKTHRFFYFIFEAQEKRVLIKFHLKYESISCNTAECISCKSRESKNIQDNFRFLVNFTAL